VTLHVSLLWRTLAVIVAALALSQVTAVLLTREFVVKPRAARTMGNFVNHLKTISAAMETMNTDEEREFIRRVAAKDGVNIVPADSMSGMELAPDQPKLRGFRDRLQEAFGRDTEVYVQAGQADAGLPTLWVLLPMGGGPDYWVAFPRRRVDDPLFAYVMWGTAGIGIALMASIFIIWRLNRPLQQLADAAEQVGKGAEPEPLPESGPSEIRAVARAFNHMTEGLQRIHRERTTFLAGISHDLRTPLSHLRIEVEVQENLDAESRRAMIEDLDDMNAILEQFIDFARNESGEPLLPVNLSELASDSVERWTRAGAHVECDLAEVPLLMLRPLAMQRLVGNLLANAVRHAGRDIEVRTAVDSGHAVLSVLDRGPGIAPGTAAHLKEAFTRKDDSRGGAAGAGLGLAIADRIARLHGGLLDLLPREGGGLEARVTLPISA
jgi:two-component system osmolarity sensor histidine kinase EnvZ